MHAAMYLSCVSNSMYDYTSRKGTLPVYLDITYACYNDIIYAQLRIQAHRYYRSTNRSTYSVRT